MRVRKVIQYERSAVTGGSPSNVSLSAGLFLSFPVNLLAFLGNGELSFEVSARSNLEDVVVSVIIMAVNVVAVDVIDVAISSFVVIIEALASEVSIRGRSVGVDVGAGLAVVLVEDQRLNALDVALSSIVKFADVLVEVVLENVDFALNFTFKLGNSAVDLVLGLVFSAGKLGFDTGLTFLSDLIDDPLGKGDGVNVDGLSVSLVAGRVEFDALS